MNQCPCCQDTLLCHISNNHIYWFCPSCWQEMPTSALANSHSFTETILRQTSKVHQKLEESSLICSKRSNNSSKLALVEA